MNVQDFIRKWDKAELNELASYQEHFIDLCGLLSHETPAKADPAGSHFCFQRGVTKQGGENGWADVWKKDHFGWEYKGKHKHKTLDEAYAQLCLYREDLQNPPALIVCDFERYEVHTNFTNSVKEVHRFTNAALGQPRNLDILRKVFFDPESLRPRYTPAKVTEEAAREFSKIADRLRERNVDPHAAAHFLMKIIFCLFAEDVGLLPKQIFAKLVEKTEEDPEEFTKYAHELFSAMQHGGRTFLLERIRHFDGGLFADSEVIDLGTNELRVLSTVAEMDWSNVEPAIFGTLFERSLNPDKRSQLGAHYTSPDDIRALVEPVLMAPLRREWSTVRAKADALRKKLEEASGKQQVRKLKAVLEGELTGFLDRLRKVRILDPACGSGNFLYLSLKLLKDLEKEVITYAANAGVAGLFPFAQPDQLHGIELNPYAQELASVVVWIGYLQWMRENGFGLTGEPILKPLKNIRLADAILDLSDPVHPKEAVWPAVDVIVSNPPFLGGKLLRRELGDQYVDAMFSVYNDRVPKEADLVCYWFEKARAHEGKKQVKRVGLLGTQGIRGGANRRVVERIKETGDIFFAISDRAWSLEGAMVHVSMVGFDGGIEKERTLDGQKVAEIHANLSSGSNITEARTLKSNLGTSFMGDTKGGKFDIPSKLAREFLRANNPNGRPNSDVVVPWVNGKDVLQAPRSMWIIDFGLDMSEQEAALYEAPFEHVKRAVKPLREKNKREAYRKHWWLHVEPRPAMREALSKLSRYIATPCTSKHRIFVRLRQGVLPDHQLIAIARDDDYTMGVLHSGVHEVWARRSGTQLREASSGCRYTPTTTYETFPFPWPFGSEPKKGEAGYDKVMAIANAARDLVSKRDVWLSPTDPKADPADYTLTKLYNSRPTWLVDVHSKLDRAVKAAYEWPEDLSEAEILKRLLELNLAQSGELNTKGKSLR